MFVLFLPARLDPGIKYECGLRYDLNREPPAIVFFYSAEYLIKSGYMESCLAAQKRFLLFKGPG